MLRPFPTLQDANACWDLLGNGRVRDCGERLTTAIIQSVQKITTGARQYRFSISFHSGVPFAMFCCPFSDHLWAHHHFKALFCRKRKWNERNM